MIIVDNTAGVTPTYKTIMHARSGWGDDTPPISSFLRFFFLSGFIGRILALLAPSKRRITLPDLVHALSRTLILIAIGTLVNASPIVGFDIHTFRFEGMTQRIALCYLVAIMMDLWSCRRTATDRLCRVCHRVFGDPAICSGARLWPARTRHSIYGSRSQSGRLAGSQAVHGTSVQRHSRSGRHPARYPGNRNHAGRCTDRTSAALYEIVGGQSMGNVLDWHSEPVCRLALEPMVSD